MARIPGSLIGSMQARNPGFLRFQIAPGREDEVGDESQHCRSPVDLFNGEEFNGVEAYTGELANPICSKFLVLVNFAMLI
jgi:hypothetical protein